MTNYVMLNNIDHFNLKTVNRFFHESGDNQAAVLTFPTEFTNIQKHYPILISKNGESGKYNAVALLGLQKDENLFLTQSEDKNGFSWAVDYVPAIVTRGPFITGFREDANGNQEAMVYADVSSPKISQDHGIPLFLEFGGNSAYLDHIIRVLNIIQTGQEMSDVMFAAFTECELIEPLTINAETANGNKYQLNGYYTIDEEKLANLSGEKLENLNKSGFLFAAYLITSSMSNIDNLIKIKNSRS